MKIYVGSVAVIKNNSVFHTPIVIQSKNNDTAYATSLRHAREMYPIDQGYYAHSVSVDEIHNLTQSKIQKYISNTLEVIEKE